MLEEVLAGRGIDLDRASRRDVVGGDGIEQETEHPRIDDVGKRCRMSPHADEIGRVLHVSGLFIPIVSQSSLHIDAAPVGIALEDVGVFLGEHLLAQRLANDAVDLATGWPDVLEEDLFALLVHPEGLLHEIGIHRARERIGNDQRRRGEIVGTHVGIDATFEVAVAGEHGGGDEILIVDRLGNLGRERTGIADAGGAAEADEIVAEFVEVLLQPGLVEIVGDHLRTRRQ